MSDEIKTNADASSANPIERDAALFSDLPVEITVSVGQAKPTISELLAMRPDSVVPLDKAIEDPVDILVGDRLIARGVLEEVIEDGNTQLAVRLTSVPGLQGR